MPSPTVACLPQSSIVDGYLHLRFRRTAGLLLAVAVVTGCGVKTTAEPPVSTLEDGRLSIDPPPVTLADLASESGGTPRLALMRLWFSIQWWDEPAILAAYAPGVVARVDRRTIVGAWALRRGSVLGARLRNVEQTRSRGLTLVTFTRESRTAAPVQESATMALLRGNWRILHDTMLEDALAAYVQSRGSRAQQTPSPAAVRRGIEASRRFRDFAATPAARSAR